MGIEALARKMKAKKSLFLRGNQYSGPSHSELTSRSKSSQAHVALSTERRKSKIEVCRDKLEQLFQQRSLKQAGEAGDNRLLEDKEGSLIESDADQLEDANPVKSILSNREEWEYPEEQNDPVKDFDPGKTTRRRFSRTNKAAKYAKSKFLKVKNQTLKIPKQLRRLSKGSNSTRERHKQPVEEPPKVNIKDLDTGKQVAIDDVNDEISRSRRSSHLEFKKQPLKVRLIALFQQYDIEMVGRVDELLQFGGLQHDELWEMMQAKYKANQEQRLMQLFLEFQPKRVKDVPQLLDKYDGHIEDLITSLRCEFQAKKLKRSQKQSDGCTWKPGQENSYQLLPTRDLRC